MEENKTTVDEAVENVNEMAVNFDKMKSDLDSKMDEILQAQANLNKSMIRSNDEEKEVGTGYGITQARKDIAMGKTAKVPYWDKKTEKRYGEYLNMVAAKDITGIKKAFGDNVQDGIANWTPVEFSSEIVRLAVQNSIALRQCKIVPMGRDQMEIPAPTGGYTAAWITAGAQILDSKYTAGAVTLDTSKLGALAIINNEDLADSIVPLAQYVAVQMGEDFGKKIDTEVFQGDSSNTPTNVFDGWEYATSVNEVAGAVDATPTFAELLTEDNLLAMVATLQDAERSGAQWYFNNEGWNAIRAIEDGASSKIVRLNEAYKYELLGYPINLQTEVAQTTATAERAAGFFGNLNWIYIGDRMNFSVQTSEHERFSYDQTLFLGLQRLAIAVALPTALARIVFGAAA